MCAHLVSSGELECAYVCERKVHKLGGCVQQVLKCEMVLL